MFYGRYQISIDEKGRIIIPSKYRAILDVGGVDQLFVTFLRPCLAFFPPAEWETYIGSLRNQHPFHSAVINLQRAIMSQTDVCSLDKQGRLLIPQQLRQVFNGERDLQLIGVQNRMELWPSKAWEEFFGKAAEEFQHWGDQLPWQPPAR